MARDMGKLEKEAEKYAIVRLWSYTDDTTDEKAKFRILDGLFEDEKHNREEINKLVSEIHAAYAEKQKAEAKKRTRK